MLAEILSAYEVLDADAMKVVTDNLGASSPIGDFPFYILIEASGSNGEHDEEKLNSFLEKMLNEGIILDGTVVTEPGKIKVSKDW